MPFDSSKPADHSPLDSAEMRGQFNGLKELIDAQAAQIAALEAQAAAQAAQIAALQGDLAAAIAGSCSNTNAVALLSLSVSDPPNQSQVQSIADKVDAHLIAARR